MTCSESADLLHVLAKRGELLDCLWDGIEEKRELEERLEWSRSTLNRALNDLEETHLVVERPDGYAVTPAGEVARELYTQSYEPFAEILPVLAHLSLGDPLDPMFVYGGRVTRADHPNPEAPIDQLRDLVSDRSEIVGMSPIGLVHHLDFFRIQNADDEPVVEFVVDEECLNHLWETYSGEMRTAVAAERCTFRKVEEMPPFSLIIVDDATAWLGIHDAAGAVKGAIVNDSDVAVEWARNVYRQYRDRSERVTRRVAPHSSAGTTSARQLGQRQTTGRPDS